MASSPPPHPFNEYEPGYPDLDMCCGLLPLEGLHRLSQMWVLSGHRVYCNMKQVKGFLQLTASPFLLYIPMNFESGYDLATIRGNIVAALEESGVMAEPYRSSKEHYECPMTVTAGAGTMVTALDLALALDLLGFRQVCVLINPDQAMCVGDFC